MNVSPVKHCRRPGYPTRPDLNNHPELLRLKPQRWQHPAIFTALAAASMLMAQQSLAQPGVEQSMVAPVFQHGDGNGAFGCVATNPPDFLSEEEARQVIIEEGKRAGLHFMPDSETLEDVYLPVHDKYGDQPEGRRRKASLTLDGVDAAHNVAFEYISSDDIDSWETRFHLSTSTVERYQIAPTAVLLRENLQQVPMTERLGIFYDPTNGQRDVPQGLVTEKGIFLVPLRSVAAWLGGQAQPGKGGTVILHCGKTTVTLTPNSATAVQDGKPVTMPAPLLERKGASYLPLSFLASVCGAERSMEISARRAIIQHPVSGERLLILASAKPEARVPLEFMRDLTEQDRKLAGESIAALSREELRMQVRDFIIWLKGQGAL
jgi:hypothetical protein